MNELFGNIITYELEKTQERQICIKIKEKNLVLKSTTTQNIKHENIALWTKRFYRVLNRGQTFKRRGPQNRTKNSK